MELSSRRVHTDVELAVSMGVGWCGDGVGMSATMWRGSSLGLGENFPKVTSDQSDPERPRDVRQGRILGQDLASDIAPVCLTCYSPSRSGWKVASGPDLLRVVRSGAVSAPDPTDPPLEIQTQADFSLIC